MTFSFPVVDEGSNHLVHVCHHTDEVVPFLFN